MCTALAGITTFVYLATWSVIVYYMVHRNMHHYRHVIIPILLILINAMFIYIHVHSTCHVGYVKTGAATIAVLFFILALNVSDFYSARCVQHNPPTRAIRRNTSLVETATGDQQET